MLVGLFRWGFDYVYNFNNYNVRKTTLDFQEQPLNFTPLTRVVLKHQGCFSEIIVGEIIVKSPYRLCPADESAWGWGGHRVGREEVRLPSE